MGIDSSTGEIRTKLDLGQPAMGTRATQRFVETLSQLGRLIGRERPNAKVQPLTAGIGVSATAYYNDEFHRRLRTVGDGSNPGPVSYLLAVGNVARPPVLDL